MLYNDLGKHYIVFPYLEDIKLAGCWAPHSYLINNVGHSFKRFLNHTIHRQHIVVNLDPELISLCEAENLEWDTSADGYFYYLHKLYRSGHRLINNQMTVCCICNLPIN